MRKAWLFTHEPQHFGFPTWSNTNRAVQPEMAVGLKFWVKEEEGLYYLFSEAKALNSGGFTVDWYQTSKWENSKICAHTYTSIYTSEKKT